MLLYNRHETTNFSSYNWKDPCVLRGWLGQGKRGQGSGCRKDWCRAELPGVRSWVELGGATAARGGKSQRVNLEIVWGHARGAGPGDQVPGSEHRAGRTDEPKDQSQVDWGRNGFREQGRRGMEVQDGSMFPAENVGARLLTPYVLFLHCLLF